MADESLLEMIGLDAAAIQERLAFFDIREEDGRRLLALAPVLETLADGLVEDFYDHILAHPTMGEFFQEPGRLERLRTAQHAHFVSLATDRHDAAYFERRLRVGLAHAEIGLEPMWYLGGYLRQWSYVIAQLPALFPDQPEELEASLTSLRKVIFLDMSLAIDAYIRSSFVERTLADAYFREAARAREALLAHEREQVRKETLLSMVLHDVRSPVTAMMATARLGLRRNPDTGAAPGKQFSLIEDSGSNVLKIIDRMVSVSRAPEDAMPIEREDFDLHAVVAECVEELQPFAQQIEHTIAVSGADSVAVRGLDRTLVRRIVTNLVVNALRHTPARCHVEVTCQQEGQTAQVWVADDGQGLPDAVHETLTRPLAAAGPAPGAFVDSGLGLPFCRLACERLGGTLLVESSGREGTRFRLDLPTG